MPPDFAFPNPQIEVWTFLTVIPEDAIPIHSRRIRFLNAVGRLAPGTTQAEADADLASVARGLEEEFPEDDDIVSLDDHPRYRSRIVEDPDGHAIELTVER